MDFDYTKPHKIVNGKPVLLTEQEIAERKAEESTVAAQRPFDEARAQLAALDNLLKLRGIREGLVGLFKWMDYIRDIPSGLDAAGVVAYLQAIPQAGTGADKLKAVDDQCAQVREIFAPK